MRLLRLLPAATVALLGAAGCRDRGDASKPAAARTADAAVSAAADAADAAPLPPLPSRRHDGHVAFDKPSARFAGADDGDRRAIADAIEQALEAWCALDAETYGAWLAPGVTRVSPAAGIVRGADAVMAALPAEWEAYERPGGAIAVTLKVRDAEIELAGDHAIAFYAVEVTGARRVRWEYEDLWLVIQVLERDPRGGFRVLHQAVAGDLDAATDEPGFDFDVAVPVTDLARAVRFYTPIFGPPEHVGPNRASFRVGAARYWLDATGLGGRALVRDGLPNGYAILQVADLERRAADLARHQVELTSAKAAHAGDRAAIGVDPAGNPFVLLEERHGTAAPPPVGPTFAESPPPAVRAVLTAWLRADPETLAAALGPDARWFDNVRSNRAELARGADAVVAGATRTWRGYDRSDAGLAAHLRVEELRVVAAGKVSVASFRTTLAGVGDHPVAEEALVTQLVADGRIVASFAVRADARDALVRGLDYVAYPAERLRKSERFFREVLELGTPYTDEDWYGFWGAHDVLGIYQASRDADGIPVPGQTSAYPSFWVASAAAIHDYLRAHGARFPVLPAINDQAGLDPQPGYIQVVGTDSEGNLLLFTEYTGQ